MEDQKLSTVGSSVNLVRIINLLGGSYDSVLCLYIAGLYAIEHSGQVFGDSSFGYIWVPSGVFK